MDINCTVITPQTDKYELEVFECDNCGFHFGLDSTFFDHADSDIEMTCPSCEIEMVISRFEE